MQQDAGSPHQSLERTLSLLLAFKPHYYEMGTVQLSKILGIHKSTVSRLLKVLTSYDFLQQNPLNKKYSLGPAVIRLSRSLDKEDLGEEIWAIGAPIPNSDNQPIASVVVAGPAQRVADIKSNSITSKLMETAKNISGHF